MTRPAAADCAAAWRAYRRGGALPLLAVVAGGAYVIAAGQWPLLQPSMRPVAAAAAIACVAARLRHNARRLRFACPRCGEPFHGRPARRLAWHSPPGRHCEHCGLALFECA